MIIHAFLRQEKKDKKKKRQKLDKKRQKLDKQIFCMALVSMYFHQNFFFLNPCHRCARGGINRRPLLYTIDPLGGQAKIFCYYLNCNILRLNVFKFFAEN